MSPLRTGQFASATHSAGASAAPPLPALRETFGSEFTLFPEGNGHCDTNGRSSFPGVCGAVLQRAIEQAAATGRAARELDDGRVLLAVPVVRDGAARGVAVGIVSLSRVDLVGRLATAGLSLHEERRQWEQQNNHVHLFSEQLSRNLEEATWLRALSESLEYCTAKHNFEDVATRTFPRLREVLRAEAVVLVTRRAAGSEVDAQQSPSAFPVWVGRPVVAPQHLAEFVETIAAGARGRPFVWNFESSHLCGNVVRVGQEIRSCILVEIRNRANHHGWILALNRIAADKRGRNSFSGKLQDRESPRDDKELRPLLSAGENEFGTVEASLVLSAAGMLAAHATNLQLFRDQSEYTLSVIRSMINVLDARDRYTCGHSERVALTAKLIAQQIGLPEGEQERIYLSGLLHDVGKVGIPDDVLLKPGRLSPEEYEIVKRHPQDGVDILRHIKPLTPMLPGVLHHHEAWDGSGYPHGLKGTEIPLMARVIAVADAFDAMTTCRPYRSARTVDEAIAILRDGAAAQWDADVVQAFLENLETVIGLSGTWESHIARIVREAGGETERVSAAIDEAALLGAAVG